MMRFISAFLTALLISAPAMAAPAGHGVDGSQLSLAWILPFVGILLSIAIFPLAAPHVWHHHFGKIALFWAAAFAVPFALTYGFELALYEIVHIILVDYVPFIILLFALFTVAGGILVAGNLHGSPATNTVILAIGTVLASLIGTTGASMVLIRPLLRANDDRRYQAHTVVFFIFLVSNIGGSLTPLGDPPLFLGFLRGVDFFWTTQHLSMETGFLALILLPVFFLIDTYFYRKEENLPRPSDPTPDSRLRLLGLQNLPLLLVIIGAILMSAYWQPGVTFNVYGTEVALQNIARDVILILAALASLWITSTELREQNGFNWEPIKEVAKLFVGIFICIIPALAILKAGSTGALAPLVALVTNEAGQPRDEMYFWMTGLLSGVLDNAPTYLVFFNLAGGDPQVLMYTLTSTLQAISGGAVFMGALTYIGNAPNFMVRSIAENRGVKMPSFFGYMAWSGAILIPSFALLTWVFFL
ncbi:sodium:proton antiporter [Agaricicola taiwanensis]|uniref:Sodium:proton antiporter n=1 Tax=Agaricicola taiwanensis TaxID=591372 RepID=A0A8J2VLL7_9RHOB|nr:sodium:proton antiporter [Agaricicola taiwanensis]GGE30153.1 sodium:proton antiporter [Agaricicola taiwanensis]